MTNPAWLVRTTCCFAVVGCLAGTLVLAQLPLARVGIAWDGPSGQDDALGLIFKTEIELVLKDEFDVRFPADKSLEADWTAEGVKDVIDRLLADPEIDLVLALGVLTSHELARRTKLPKPVFAPFVLNPELRGIPYEIRESPLARPGETERVRISGVRNLSYVTAGVDLLRDVTQFQEITLFSRLAVLTLESLEKAGVGLQRELADRLGSLNLEQIQIVPVGSSTQIALDAIPSSAQAIYVTPLPHLSAADFDRLVQALMDRRLPSFSLKGALAHESELARNEPDSQVHHLPRAYDDGLPSSAIRLRM